MSRTDREDATAKALDLLPPGDEARSDPRLMRDPELLDEARLTREAAADVWLAVSPLRAAPSDVLHAVMARIDAKPPAAAKVRRFTPWLAASGWAAAVAVAVGLWPRGEQSAQKTVAAGKDYSAAGESAKVQVQGSPNDLVTIPEREDRRMRGELMQLRSRLERLNDEAFKTSPRVMALSSPGGIERTPEEARDRVSAILMGALRSALEAESGAPGDPAALVIERGWLPDSVAAPAEGEVIRHRHFPEESWEELGLLRSDDGAYYDPQKQVVWTKDEEGRGFIGQLAAAGTDLSIFKQPGEAPALATNQIRTEPEGFIIEDPLRKSFDVVIDSLPRPSDGTTQVVRWESGDGNINEVPLNTAVASSKSNSSQGQTSGYSGPPRTVAGTSQSANSATLQASASLDVLPVGISNTIVFSIPNSGGVTSFQLIEKPVVPNGKPFKVIVKGGKN
ncbi:hypothetical protein [Luteolibacter luteus]|uniref:Uncharacterized protein n=1 Tax=Luteolibacter luteus TaxID=2728835 RepID=A0A858RN16_9BACT|nr:hypothetical protein [Luteolibacter luteus]QJE98105.1 hypothetical protein HHL09_20720 [Luteolibacter luteus]